MWGMTEPHADQHRNLDQEPASGQSSTELPKQRGPAHPRTAGDTGSGHNSPPSKGKRPAAMRPTPGRVSSNLSIPEQSGNLRMPSEPNGSSRGDTNRTTATESGGTSTTTQAAKPASASTSTAKGGAAPPTSKQPGGAPAGAHPGTTKPERASGLPADQARDWAFAAHVGSFLLAYVGLGFVCPLIVLLAKGKASPYVRHHAVESLNFQLTALGAAVIALVLAFVYVGLVLLPFVAIVDVVLVVMAGLAARRGEWYRYPVSIRVIN
jgi:uncharacterized protein